jgi:hypothetical protein|tara:strand:- start:690 stop:956 length:267 start_codon:yes stop_codon:yes gene_type:complete
LEILAKKTCGFFSETINKEGIWPLSLIGEHRTHSQAFSKKTDHEVKVSALKQHFTQSHWHSGSRTGSMLLWTTKTALTGKNKLNGGML